MLACRGRLSWTTRRWISGRSVSDGLAGFDYFDDDSVDELSSSSSSSPLSSMEGEVQRRGGKTSKELSDAEFGRFLDGFEVRAVESQKRQRRVPMNAGFGFQKDNVFHPRTEEIENVPLAKMVLPPPVDLTAKDLSASTIDFKEKTEEIVKKMTEMDPKNPAALELYEHAVQQLNIIPNRDMIYLALRATVGVASTHYLDKILKDIYRHGIHPSARMYNMALLCYFRAGKLEGLQHLLADMWKTGGAATPTPQSYYYYVRTAVKQQDIARAVAALEDMSQRGLRPNTDTLKALLALPLRNGDVDESWDLLTKVRKDFKEEVTVEHLVDAVVEFARLGQFDMVMSLLKSVRVQLQKKKVSIEVGAMTSVIVCAAPYHRLDVMDQCCHLIRSLYPTMHPLDDVYCSLANTRAEVGSVEAAIDALFELDNGTAVTSLNSLRGFINTLRSSSEARIIAEEYLRRCTRRHQKIPLAAVNCLIAGFACCGDFEAAWHLISNLRVVYGLSPNVDSFNAILEGCEIHDDVSEMRRVSMQMIRAKVAGDQMTCELLVRILVRQGDTKTLGQILDRVVADNIEPSRMCLRIAALCCFETGAGIVLKMIVKHAKTFGYSIHDILPEVYDDGSSDAQIGNM